MTKDWSRRGFRQAVGRPVAEPDGRRDAGPVLWVTLAFQPVGAISLRDGSETMAQYSAGRFAVSGDDVRSYSAVPDTSNFQQILSVPSSARPPSRDVPFG
jgi:hypothetical protein